MRLSAGTGTRPFLNFLMLAGFLQPGYDYLLERKLPALLRESKYHPIGAQLDRFLAGAAKLGYADGPSKGMASQVAGRVLIQTGRTLDALTPADFAEFEAAIEQRETNHGRDFKHYRGALFASRAVIYHLGCPAEPAVKRSTLLGWSWERHLTGVPPQLQASLVAYLECAAGTRTRSTVSHMASRLAHFARQLTVIDPELTTLAGLDRQRHIEPYLAAIAAAPHPHTGAPLSASERRSRVHTLGRMIDDINEWGWVEAPGRRLIFPRDAPRLPRPLPRYLPPDADRRLAAALGESGNRLRADALLLAGRPGCGSANSSIWNWTACMRYPARAPGSRCRWASWTPNGWCHWTRKRSSWSTGSPSTVPRAGRCEIPAPAGCPISCSPTTADGSPKTYCATS